VGHMQDIYTEYSRMRDNGMDAKSVLNVLRQHIEALSKSEREELAGQLRAWEARSAAAPVAAKPKPEPIAKVSSSIKPLQPLSAAPQAAVKTPETDEHEAMWVTCATCGKSNQKHEVFCYSCGQLLDSGKGMSDTRHFNTPDSSPLDSEFYGPDSVLALRVRGSTDPYELRPQKVDHEMIIGRSTTGNAMAPDIDLDKKQGADLGVSRMHLSIRYDQEHQAVLVSDLGSANGTFLNGQRLLTKEIRVLRHGDELRLGKLVLVVSFRHPNATQ
jgi:hypothetical protein